MKIIYVSTFKNTEKSETPIKPSLLPHSRNVLWRNLTQHENKEPQVIRAVCTQQNEGAGQQEGWSSGRKNNHLIKEKRSETWSSSHLQETTFAKLKFKRQSLFAKYLCWWFPSERLLKYFFSSLVFMLCYWLKWKSLWTAIWKLPMRIAVIGHWHRPAPPQHRCSLRTKTLAVSRMILHHWRCSTASNDVSQNAKLTKLPWKTRLDSCQGS